MKLNHTIALGALILCGAAAMAQGGPGQGRMGGMMGMMRGGMPSMDGFLLNSPDVQKDLKLTDDQKTKLTKVNEEMRASFQPLPPGGTGGRPAFDPQEMQARMKKNNEAFLAILDDTQKTRVHQIALQVAGGQALMREDVQKDLDLKVAQKQSLNDLSQKQQEANMKLFQAVRNQEMTREEVQAAMKKNNDILLEEALKVLTTEQKTKFDTMKGAKFEGKVEMTGMFGGRPGGRTGGGRRGGAGQGGGSTPPQA